MRRTQLRRTAGPRRRTRLTRSTGLQAVPWSRAVPVLAGEVRSAARTRRGGGASGEFSAKVKLQCRTRAGNGDPDQARCEATGAWLGRYGGEIQHRDARGMGGTSDPVAGSIVNAVLLSREAHRLAESRDEHMNAMGFWLKNGQDPRAEPVMLHGAGGGGLTVWLAEDGLGPDGTGYLLTAPKELAA